MGAGRIPVPLAMTSELMHMPTASSSLVLRYLLQMHSCLFRHLICFTLSLLLFSKIGSRRGCCDNDGTATTTKTTTNDDVRPPRKLPLVAIALISLVFIFALIVIIITALAVVCHCPPSSHLVKKTQEPLQPRDHRRSCCCHSWLVT